MWPFHALHELYTALECFARAGLLSFFCIHLPTLRLDKYGQLRFEHPVWVFLPLRCFQMVPTREEVVGPLEVLLDRRELRSL